MKNLTFADVVKLVGATIPEGLTPLEELRVVTRAFCADPTRGRFSEEELHEIDVACERHVNPDFAKGVDVK